MSDSPYGLDFFQKVTDCHFGTAVWISVNGTGQDPFTGGWIGSVDFPGEAGGTPGVDLVNGLVVNPAFHVPASFSETYTVTKADLTNPLRTRAGAPLIGFGAGQVPPKEHANAYCFLSLNRFLPQSTPFKVRMRSNLAGGGGFSANVQVRVYKSIVAGKTIGQLLATAAGFQETIISGIGTQDFTINPTKLTVALG